MGTKTMLKRGGVLLLAALFFTGCGDEGADVKKDKSEKDDEDDGDEKKTKKKKKDDDDEKKDAKSDSVFTKRDVTVGDKRTRTSIMAMTLEVEAAGQKKSMKQGETKEKDEEVLEVKDGRPSKIKVTYKKKNKSMQEAGPPQTKAEPIEGKTYVVEEKDGEVIVTTEDGGKPPLAEVTAVKKDFQKSFGKDSKAKAFAEALLTAKLEKGKRATDVEKLFNEAFGPGLSDDGKKAPKVGEVKLTYQGTEGDHALFDIEMTMKVDEGPMKMSMPLKGKLKILREGAQMGTVTLKGPIELDTTGSPIPIKGKGELSMEEKAVYELKK